MQEQFILSVEVDGGASDEKLLQITKHIQDLKKQQADLKKSQNELKGSFKALAEDIDNVETAFDAGTLTAEQYDHEMSLLAKVADDLNTQQAELTITQQKLSNEIKANETSQKSLIASSELASKTAKEYDDTLNGQRLLLADMQKAYAELSAEQRDTSAGQAFRNEIKLQSEKVKALEGGIGDMRRNVGNYAESIKQAIPNVSKFGNSLKALAMNPVGAVMQALMLVMNALRDAFGRSEENTNKLNKAFAPLKSIVDLVMQAFDKLASIIIGSVIKAINAVSSIIGKLVSKFGELAQAMGFDVDLAEAADNAKKNLQELQKAEEDYAKHNRQYIEEEAERQNQLAKLKDKIADKDTYDAKTRIAYLKQSNKIELDSANEKIALAKEQLRIAELQANQTENDKEANDNLARARAAVTNAETEYFNKKSTLTKQLTTAEREYRAEQEQAIKEERSFWDNKEKEELASIENEIKAEEEATAKIIEEQNKRLQAIKEHNEQRKAILADYGLTETLTIEEQLEQERELRLEKLNEYREQELLTEEEFNMARLNVEQAYQEQLAEMRNAEIAKADEFQRQSMQAMANNAKENVGAMTQLMQAYAGESENAQEIMKGVAMSTLLISEAQSIANGAQAISAAAAGAAQAAAAGGPAAPALLAAYTAQMVGSIIAITTSVASTIVQAKQILQQADAGKFAEGGFVGGASYSGDKMIAHVNSGESILTPQQQKNFMELANNGSVANFDYEKMGNIISQCLQDMQPPTLVYSEFKEFEQNVVQLDEMAKY